MKVVQTPWCRSMPWRKPPLHPGKESQTLLLHNEPFNYVWMSSIHHGQTVCPIGQCAVTLTLHTLRNPTPPRTMGQFGALLMSNDMSGLMCKMVHKHCQMPSLWDLAHSATAWFDHNSPKPKQKCKKEDQTNCKSKDNWD